MQYTYVVVYRLLGGPSLGTKEISRINSPGLKVFLTPNPDPHCYHIDRGLTIKTEAFNGLFGDAKKDQFHSTIQNGIREIQEWRKKEVGVGTCLVIQIDGDTPTFASDNFQEKDDFVLWMDIISKKTILDKHVHDINNITMSFVIESKSKCRVSKVCFGIYLTNESGKIIYPCQMEMNSGTVLVSNQMDDSSDESFSNRINQMLQDDEFKIVNSNLMAAYQNLDDNHKAFSFAWAALEVFTNKVFSMNNEKALNLFVQRPDFGERFKVFNRPVPTDQSSFLDRWISITSLFLKDEYSFEDTVLFSNAKVLRNKAAHGEGVVDVLPVEDVMYLTAKYMDIFFKNENS